jgi:hypothetical protein
LCAAANHGSSLPQTSGGENWVLSAAFILRYRWLLQQTESDSRHAVPSGLDVLVCIPASPAGLQAIARALVTITCLSTVSIRALVTITCLSTVSIRVLATAIRLPAVTVRMRPPVVHLIGATVGTFTPAIPPSITSSWCLSATIQITTVCVRTLVTMIGTPSFCMLAIVAIIVTRALVAMFETTFPVTIIAVTPAGLIPVTGAALHRRMTLVVVMPLMPVMSLLFMMSLMPVMTMPGIVIVAHA